MRTRVVFSCLFSWRLSYSADLHLLPRFRQQSLRQWQAVIPRKLLVPVAWVNLLAVIRAWAGAAVSQSSAWTCCHSQPLLGHRWVVYSNLKKTCNKVVQPCWSHHSQRPFPFLGYCGSLLPLASHLYQLEMIRFRTGCGQALSQKERLHCHSVVAAENWKIREDNGEVQAWSFFYVEWSQDVPLYEVQQRKTWAALAFLCTVPFQSAWY